MAKDEEVDPFDCILAVAMVGAGLGICWGTFRLAAVTAGYAEPMLPIDNRGNPPVLIQGIGALLGWMICGGLMGFGTGIVSVVLYAIGKHLKLSDFRWLFAGNRPLQLKMELEDAHEVLKAIRRHELPKETAILVGSLNAHLKRAREFL